MATTPGYWPVRYWPETDYYFWPTDYWPEYGAVTYDLLVKAGYWPNTSYNYWPACYWQEDYWPEYGAVSGFAYVQSFIIY